MADIGRMIAGYIGENPDEAKEYGGPEGRRVLERIAASDRAHEAINAIAKNTESGAHGG